MAQQLRDACRKWLLAEPRDVEGVIDLVVLEQFVARLPRRTAEWVRCHRPTSLAQAIQLAEDHLAACPGVGEPRPNLSLSLSLFPLPSQFPLSLAQSPLPGRGYRWPLEPRHGVGMARLTVTPGEGGGGGQSPLPLHIISPAIPCPPFLSKEKTAFTTPFGLHQFVTLPFDLFGAPATFQRLMDKVLRPQSAYAAAYLDDIIIHSNDWQRHMEHLRTVLRALRVAGLTANPRKCAIVWRYGIWASTWVMGRCVPKLTRQLQLGPAQVPRPKRR